MFKLRHVEWIGDLERLKWHNEMGRRMLYTSYAMNSDN
jgi:hypothetical protein